MISGLVVHLAADAPLSDEAFSRLQNRPGLEMGELFGQRLPVVVESTETASAEQTTEWLRDQPGVLHVDVTFVHLDETACPQSGNDG